MYARVMVASQVDDVRGRRRGRDLALVRACVTVPYWLDLRGKEENAQMLATRLSFKGYLLEQGKG